MVYLSKQKSLFVSKCMIVILEFKKRITHMLINILVNIEKKTKFD